MTPTTSLADILPHEALATGGSRLGSTTGVLAPEAIVRPESTEEVAATLGWAAAAGVAVLPFSSGRRLGRRAFEGRLIFLVTDRLRGIEIYEPADLTLTARAGTPLAAVSSALAANRQWLPFDPPFVDDRSLGGLVATGESGPTAAAFGELRNHVLGATLVTGEGRVLRLGGRVVKNVAGFDLLKPVVGSRGRLGVITSVCLRAFPVPTEDRVLVLRADRVADLAAAASAIRTASLLPVSSVLISPADVLGAGAALLVRLQGARPAVDADQRTLEAHAGVTFERASDMAATLRTARDHAASGPATLGVSVLPSRLAQALEAVADLLGDVPVAADTYLGKVRVAVRDAEPAAAHKLCERVQALGGALSVRVGDRADAATAELSAAASPPSPDEAALVAGLDRVFDPKGVLRPCRR